MELAFDPTQLGQRISEIESPFLVDETMDVACGLEVLRGPWARVEERQLRLICRALRWPSAEGATGGAAVDDQAI